MEIEHQGFNSGEKMENNVQGGSNEYNRKMETTEIEENQEENMFNFKLKSRTSKKKKSRYEYDVQIFEEYGIKNGIKN